MTPLRVVLLLAMLVSAAVAAYGLLLDRAGNAILLTVVGLAILGLTLGIFGLMLASASVRAGWAGRGGRAFLGALLGGIFVLAASGSLASAVILGILLRF